MATSRRTAKSKLDAQQTLKLFVEKADKLYGLRFTRHLLDGGRIGFSVTAHDDGAVVQRQGPDEDAIDAFVLTLRFFVQNNEPTSFENMERLFARLPLETRRIDAASGSRRVLNEYLDRCSYFVVKEQRLTHRDIFDVFLWGGLAHANAEKKEIYDGWAENDVGFPALQMAFTDILVTVLNVISWFRKASLEALEILSGQFKDAEV